MASAQIKRDFYVYAHRRGDTGEVFYVGKGRGRRAHCRSGRNELWSRIVRKHGLTIEFLHARLSENEAFELEVTAIATFSPVANFTAGGEGISGYRHTIETREALSRAHAGRTQDRAVVEARTRKLRGKKRTPEFSAKMAEIHRGRRHSDDTRAKMSAARTGLARSPDAISRTADWHRGRQRSADARRNMSEAQPKRAVVSVATGLQFESISAAAAWLVGVGHSKATKAGVWAACKRAGSYLGHSWAYADGAA